MQPKKLFPGSATSMRGVEKSNFSSLKQMETLPTTDIFNVPIALIEQGASVEFVGECIRRNQKGWVTGINGHALNLAYSLPWLQNFYKNALLNCSEGVGVVVAAWLSGTKIPRRKAWAEWAYDLLRMLEKEHYSLYLLGSIDEVGQKAVQKLLEQFPKLQIVGQTNGYYQQNETAFIIEAINRVKPDVLFVALGMPKQEEWIHTHFDELDVKLFFPVGALLEYLSGMKKRCPLWMSSLGIEWLYRLLTEPRRVWRRYLLGNPQLVYRAVCARFSR
jgi:N-acetylglucosaminyldiphosphoundecaprenol N-acetyl-beta-D-mannosaminyltransferase